MSRTATFTEWLLIAWQRKGNRRAVVDGYTALASHPETLADIALRGSVFQSAPPGLSVYDAGVVEGRRQMALEIIKAAKQDALSVYQAIEQADQSNQGRQA